MIDQRRQQIGQSEHGTAFPQEHTQHRQQNHWPQRRAFAVDGVLQKEHEVPGEDCLKWGIHPGEPRHLDLPDGDRQNDDDQPADGGAVSSLPDQPGCGQYAKLETAVTSRPANSGVKPVSRKAATTY